MKFKSHQGEKMTYASKEIENFIENFPDIKTNSWYEHSKYNCEIADFLKGINQLDMIYAYLFTQDMSIINILKLSILFIIILKLELFIVLKFMIIVSILYFL